MEIQSQNLNWGETDPGPKLFPRRTLEPLGGTQGPLPCLSVSRNKVLTPAFSYITMPERRAFRGRCGAAKLHLPLRLTPCSSRCTWLFLFLPWGWKEILRDSAAEDEATPSSVFPYARRSSGNQLTTPRKDGKEAATWVHLETLG